MNKRTSTLCALIVACAVPGFAMQTPGSAPAKPQPGTQQPGTQQPGTQQPGTQQPGAAHQGATNQRSAMQLQRGDKLIGTELKDSAGGRIGRIDDLILMNDGRIGYVVVDTQTQLVPIPWSSIQSPAPMTGTGATDKTGATGSMDRGDYTARIDAAKLKGAPGFERTAWPKDNDMSVFRESDTYFGRGGATTPGATPPGSGKPTEAGASTAMGMRSSQLGKQTVVDAQGNQIGTVSQVIYDPASGRANYAAVSLSGVQGASGRVIAVPWELLRSTRQNDKTNLTLSVPADRLQGAPQFQSTDDAWKRMSDPAWASEVYQYYSIKPYWSDKDMNREGKDKDAREHKDKETRPKGE